MVSGDANQLEGGQALHPQDVLQAQPGMHSCPGQSQGEVLLGSEAEEVPRLVLCGGCVLCHSKPFAY